MGLISFAKDLPAFFPKYHTPAAIQALTPGLLWRVRTQAKTIYLTFDDGPNPKATLWALGVLESFGAKATFFCVGDNIRKHPDIFEKVKEAGHQVANHTYHHLDIFKHKRNHYLDNVKLCEQHTATKLFRPPYGKLTLPLFFELKRQGYAIVMWDILSRDFAKNLNCDESLAAMKARLTAGSIPLFHDSEKAFHNLQRLLPLFLEEVCRQGFEFGLLPSRAMN